MSSPLTAQDGQTDAQADTTEADRPGGTLVPLPALFYQTETGLGFGAAITYFLPPPTDSGNGSVQHDQASQLQFFAIYTTKKQTAIQFGAELYPSGGKFRLLGSVTFVKFPTKYWGIGNNTPNAAEEDFTPLSFIVDGDFQRELRPTWYAGLLGQFVIRNLEEVEPGGLLDSGNTPGAEDGRIAFEMLDVALASLNSDERPLRLRLRLATSCGAWGEARRALGQLIERRPSEDLRFTVIESR